MPLYSIQRYLQNALNDLALPSVVPGPLVARITPPVAEKISVPHAYVWGGRLRASRQTAPRVKGFTRYPWTCDCWLVYLDTPDDAMANEPFAQVIDAVMAQLQAVTMPVLIDPDGNVVTEALADKTCSQIQAIGETFDLDYPPEKLAQSQRMVWYSARLGVDILEVIQR